MNPSLQCIDDIVKINSIVSRRDGVEIVKIRCDVSSESFMVLRNIVKTADDCWKDLAVKTGFRKWSDDEKNDLLKISTALLQTKEKLIEIESQEYLDRITRQIRHKWLNFDENTGKVSLSPKFLAQM